MWKLWSSVFTVGPDTDDQAQEGECRHDKVHLEL